MNMSDPQKYTVGCICALVTESVAMQSMLDEEHQELTEAAQHDNNSYALGRIGKSQHSDHNLASWAIWSPQTRNHCEGHDTHLSQHSHRSHGWHRWWCAQSKA